MQEFLIQSWSVLLRKNIQHTVTDKLVKEQLKPDMSSIYMGCGLHDDWVGGCHAA